MQILNVPDADDRRSPSPSVSSDAQSLTTHSSNPEQKAQSHVERGVLGLSRERHVFGANRDNDSAAKPLEDMGELSQIVDEPEGSETVGAVHDCVEYSDSQDLAHREAARSASVGLVEEVCGEALGRYEAVLTVENVLSSSRDNLDEQECAGGEGPNDDQEIATDISEVHEDPASIDEPAPAQSLADTIDPEPEPIPENDDLLAPPTKQTSEEISASETPTAAKVDPEDAETQVPPSTSETSEFPSNMGPTEEMSVPKTHASRKANPRDAEAQRPPSTSKGTGDSVHISTKEVHAEVPVTTQKTADADHEEAKTRVAPRPSLDETSSSESSWVLVDDGVESESPTANPTAPMMAKSEKSPASSKLPAESKNHPEIRSGAFDEAGGSESAPETKSGKSRVQVEASVKSVGKTKAHPVDSLEVQQIVDR